MYAVSLSLGASNAYVAVTPITTPSHAPSAQSPLVAPCVRLVANAAGHRSTPVTAAFTEHETIFGDIANHLYAREPQNVVPYVFAYAAAAAAVTDCGDRAEGKLASADFLRRVVSAASQRKFRGHCALRQEEDTEGAKHKRSHRLGFTHTPTSATRPDEAAVEEFTSAEDLFIQFLDYIKHHVVDAACGLTAGDGGTREGVSRVLCLTVVVPRYAFPSAMCAGNDGLGRGAATQWLYEAVRSSQLGEVAERVAVLFSDEATMLAYDSVGSLSLRCRESLLLSTRSPHALRASRGDIQAEVTTKKEREFVTQNAIAEDEDKVINVLVVDWGVHTLAFTLLALRDGILLERSVAPGEEGWSGATAFMCFAGVPCRATARSTLQADAQPEFASCYFSELCGCGGDAVDTALAERVAAHFIMQHRHHFTTLTRAQTTALGQAGHSILPADLTAPAAKTDNADKRGYGDGAAAGVIAELIPGRALRRLRLLISDKKVALNTNQQTVNVAVEVEAFYEGMDLMDTQVLNRNKFDAAVRGEWGLTELFDKAWDAFVKRYRGTLMTHSVSRVLLTGGMCQIACLANHIRQRFVAQSLRVSAPNSQSQTECVAKSVVSPNVAVLDATAITGSGVSMDELACLGGGQHSFQRAVAALRAQEMRPQLGRPFKQKGRKEELRQCEAMAAAQRAFQFTERVVNDRRNEAVGDGADERAIEVEFLEQDIYLYSGDCDSASLQQSEPVLWIDTHNLMHLFARQSPLPCRRILCLDAAALVRPVLYLFVDAATCDLSAQGERRPMSALTTSGVVIDSSGRAESVSGGVVHIVVTVYCRLGDDGTKHAFLSIERESAETTEAAGDTNQICELALQ